MYAIVHMDVADAICRVYLPIFKKKKKKKTGALLASKKRNTLRISFFKLLVHVWIWYWVGLDFYERMD